MAEQRIYEGDTVRVAVTALTHSDIGVMDQNATVEYEVFRAAGTSYDDGTLTYSGKAAAWIADFTAPGTVASNPEQLLIEVTATAGGAVRKDRVTINVYNAGP